MAFFADLHIHSRYSRATSRDCDLEHLAWWARRKGLTVVATGDFTHPAWFDELRQKLVPAEPGLFRLRPDLEREGERLVPAACARPVRFLLEVEISTIYKKGERTRKVHHLIYAASFDTASRLREGLGEIGNLASDGRPILGLDSRDLLEITLESGSDAYLVPAHVWTPWFSVLGSKSGFDSVEECYRDLAGHIFAVETGLSSDPPMNWRVSRLDRFTLVSSSDAHSPPMLGREACRFDTDLDYFAMRRALRTGEGWGGTVELFPEEGKYHLDGHRACGVRLEPGETRRRDGRCPECGKPVTVGVMHRVEALADRPQGVRRDRPCGYRSLVPLPEVVAEIRGVGPRSKTVERAVADLVARLGPEMEILERLPVEEVAAAGGLLLAEAVTRLRQGRVRCQAGYDGEYGVVRLFDPGELAQRAVVAPLFGPPLDGEPPSPPRPPSPTPSREEREPPTRPAAGNRPRGDGCSLLEGLDPEQRAAAEVVEGPLLILAGPGTGKTRTLTHRLAHLLADGGVAPEHCLAVTFTRRAAAEMAERLASLAPGTADRLVVTTFHGLGLGILRERAAELGLPAGFRVAGAAEAVELAREVFGSPAPETRRRLEEIGRARRAAEGSPELEAWEAALGRRGLVDFEDLLALPVRLLGERPEVAASYRRRFRWISVDEYQDVDPLQYRLLRLLAPPDANLCVIGDPDQSIYRFRGAEVGFFLRFREDFPHARVVRLRRNYRSRPAIVTAASQAIRPGSLVPERRLEAVRSEGPERVVLQEAASDRAEAELVVHTVERMVGGTSYFSLDSGRVEGGDGHELSFGDFAVLYRTDAQAAVLVEALGRSGIPFQKRSHRPLGERPAVRALLRGLEAAAQGAGEPAPRSVEGLLDRTARELAAARGPAAGAGTAQAAEAVELLRPLAARCGDDLAGFLAAAALGAEMDTWQERAERVSLLTLHAAKGLEFPVVFLVGCEDGLLPLRRPGSEEGVDLEEERRLFFVGMTRARDLLVLTRARQRRLYGTVRQTAPSPFLADIEEALLDRRHPETGKPHRPEPRQLRLL